MLLAMLQLLHHGQLNYQSGTFFVESFSSLEDLLPQLSILCYYQNRDILHAWAQVLAVYIEYTSWLVVWFHWVLLLVIDYQQRTVSDVKT